MANIKPDPREAGKIIMSQKEKFAVSSEKTSMRYKTPAQILRKAAQLVRKGWTQGTFARSKTGKEVSLYSRRATCFCMLGAIERASGKTGPMWQYRDAVNALEKVLRTAFFTSWNDRKGQTAENVALRLEKAADKWESKHAL